MGRTILVTGYDTDFGRSITEEALKASYSVVATTDPGAGAASDREDLLIVEWNRGSLLSARNVVLAGANHFGSVDDTVVTYLAGKDHAPLHELQSVTIEEAVDRRLKSQIYLLKETLGHFALGSADPPSRLGLVMYGGNLEFLSPLESTTAGGFLHLSQSLMNMYQNEPFSIYGFHSGSQETEEFAEFVVGALSGAVKTRPGRWYRFSRRPFPGMPVPAR